MNIEQLLSPDLATRNPKGLFLLTGIERGFDGNRPVRLLHLSDWTGTCTVRDQWNISRTVLGLRLPIPVCVDLQRWDRPEGRSFSVIDVYRAADWEMAPGLELLPESVVPTEALLAFRKLVRFTVRIANLLLSQRQLSCALTPQKLIVVRQGFARRVDVGTSWRLICSQPEWIEKRLG